MRSPHLALSLLIAAALASTCGVYDLWEAALPANNGSLVRNYFELRDGAALTYVGPAEASGTLASGAREAAWDGRDVTGERGHAV